MNLQNIILLSALTFPLAVSGAEARVTMEHSGQGGAFHFKSVAAPRRQDAAVNGKFTLVDGSRDPNGAELDALTDGRLPKEEDQPNANFFFRAGTSGGRLLLDLGAASEIKSINTYSWHPDARGPQVYTVWGTTNANSSPAPKRPLDPATNGWVLIAKVDTRKPGQDEGGQYGVSIAAPSDGLTCRYLLWDVQPTDPTNVFANTFFSEIDVITANTPPETARDIAGADPDQGRQTVSLEGGYEILLDTSEVPDLTDWAKEALVPMMREWYPKIVALLPSDNYQAPKRVWVNIRKDMGGVAATSGTRVNCSAEWMRRELKGEAVGAVFHELVHVVQQYGRARRNNPAATNPPGWVVEGIPDYLRWFVYEPQTRGAEISARNVARARYDASYRVSANFLNWVVENHDKEIVKKLNAVCREGKYSDEIWKKATGKTVEELGDLWKTSLTERAAKASS